MKQNRDYKVVLKRGKWLLSDSQKNNNDIFDLTVCVIVISVLLLIATCFKCHASDTLIDMNKIMMIESSGNPLAHNKRDDSRGLYQITPIVLTEWNNFHPRRIYKPTDLWSPAVNFEIADWYMNVRIPSMFKYFNIKDTVQNRIIAYNAGISYLTKKKEIPTITKKYIEKYARIK